jgi:hypothetical protein
MKISSEEENIDSFDVSPKSGRWDVTETGATDDRIIDGNLRLITTENTTSESSEYFMKRGLQKTDSNIEYRYKAQMDNQSQVDYFTSVLGDSADFEEGDSEGWVDNQLDQTISNGILTLNPSGAVSSADFCINACNNIAPQLNGHIYKKLEFTARINEEYQTAGESINILYRTGAWPSGSEPSIAILTNLTTQWQDFSLSFPNIEKFYFSRFRLDDLDDGTLTTTEALEFKEIKFVGDLDYATHAEGEVEDTWDWEDSLDYFTDSVLDNTSDFNDGTTEGWVDGGAGTVSNAGNEYLKYIGSGANIISEIIRSSLSISASTYNWIAFEFNASLDITQIDVYDAGTNLLCTDSTGWTNSTWHLFSCDLSGANWAGTETGFIIDLNHASSSDRIFFYNMVYLYDTELGDLEDYAPNAFSYLYINPEGYLTSSFGSGTSKTIVTGTGYNPDKTVFDILKIRMRSSSAGTRIQIQNKAGTVDYQNGGTTTLTTSFIEYVYDLSLDSDWTGSNTVWGIYFDDGGGSFEGDERLIIDYILLLSSTEQQQDFTIGFYDQDNSQADLLNVTHHFYNSTWFRWEIELYDSNQEIASYYYSSTYPVSNEYFLGKITYNILESELTFRLNADNGTNVLNVDWRDEFTTTGLPYFFAFEIAPYLYVSTYTVFYGHQEVWIDFFNAPFKELSWNQVTTPTDTNWDVDTPLGVGAIPSIGVSDNPQSTYRLNVPYLDAFSGFMVHDFTNYTLIALDRVYTYFRIYAVDSDDGDLHEVLEIQHVSENGKFFYLISDGSTFEESYVDAVTVQGSSGVDFTGGLTNDRSELYISAGFYSDLFGNVSTFGLANITLADITSDYSQEFVMEVDYVIDRLNSGGNGKVRLSYQHFSFLQRDLFGDIISGLISWASPTAGKIVEIAEQSGGGGNIFDTIFKVAADILGFSWLLEGFRGVINGLGEFLRPLFDTLANLLSPLAQAIADIAASIWDAFVDVTSEVLNALLALLLDITDAVINIGLTVWDDFWSFIFDTLDPTGDLGNAIDNLWNLDIATMLSDMLGLVTFVMSLWPFVIIFLVFYIFSLPFLANNGDVYKGTQGMFNNMFRGVKTPHMTLLGFGGQIVIPLIVLLYIALKLLIAAGTFPDIFG